MTITIQPKNDEVSDLQMVNGFWPAFCVETPVSKVVDCHYKDETKMIIVHEHDGYNGGWFSEEDALEMHRLLSDYIETEYFKNHPYFGTRKNQMDAIMDFLPICGGFRKA